MKSYTFLLILVLFNVLVKAEDPPQTTGSDESFGTEQTEEPEEPLTLRPRTTTPKPDPRCWDCPKLNKMKQLKPRARMGKYCNLEADQKTGFKNMSSPSGLSCLPKNLHAQNLRDYCCIWGEDIGCQLIVADKKYVSDDWAQDRCQNMCSKNCPLETRKSSAIKLYCSWIMLGVIMISKGFVGIF